MSNLNYFFYEFFDRILINKIYKHVQLQFKIVFPFYVIMIIEMNGINFQNPIYAWFLHHFTKHCPFAFGFNKVLMAG